MQEHLNNNFEEENFLPGMEKKNPFAVPANYFTASANLLEYRYELAALPKLSAIKKPAVEKAPADYFTAFEEKMAKRLLQTEEPEEFAVLNAIEKKNSFAVTPGYFDMVADHVKEKYHEANRPRVPVFEKIRQFVFNPRVAVSFVVVVFIGIAAIRNASQTDNVLPAGDCKTLACLEKNEMLNEQTARDFDDENLYEMVDVEALDQQLSGTTDSLNVNKDASDSIKKNNEKN